MKAFATLLMESRRDWPRLRAQRLRGSKRLSLPLMLEQVALKLATSKLMDQKRRIAIYGGSFDPVHLGHLEVARQVSRIFELNEVLFVPALHAPHKLSRAVTSHLHRYAMLILATQREPRASISTFELEASDRRYTVDTLAHFQASSAADVEFFFIMGADSWAEITTWREWQRLLSMCNH